MSNQTDRYEDVFTPGAPVMLERFMVGREQEKKDLRSTLSRAGQHAIVIGDRGVGKTTLVKHVLKQIDRPSVWYPASPRLTYDQVFRDLLRNLGVDLTQVEKQCDETVETHLKVKPLFLSLETGGATKTTSKYKPKDTDELTPWTVFQYLKTSAHDAIIVIDEYDAFSSSEEDTHFHEGIAYTIKHLGDHSNECNARIIVVGVAYSAESLLGPHESVRRNAKEIYLKPLRYSDIFEFLQEAENYLNIHFDPIVKQRIARGSMGYPYFVHLIGLESIDAMLSRDRKSKLITFPDFKIAVAKAVESEMRDAVQKFKSKATALTQAENILLVELTWWKAFTADRKEFIAYIHKKHRIDELEINSALMKLAQERRFIYLSRHKDDIRFGDPLMKAFLREKIFTETIKGKLKVFPQIRLPSF